MKLAVVSRGQPSGDFNVEPTKIHCLLQGISAWLWIDLEASWALAAGGVAAVACKRDLACLGDFLLSGAPSAAAALGGCWVDGCRWIQPHLAVCASFDAARWSATVCQLFQFTALGPPSWASALDKSRGAKSAEVGERFDVSVMISFNLFRLVMRQSLLGLWRLGMFMGPGRLGLLLLLRGL